MQNWGSVTLELSPKIFQTQLEKILQFAKKSLSLSLCINLLLERRAAVQTHSTFFYKNQ